MHSTLTTVQTVTRRGGVWKIVALAVAGAVFCAANFVNALYKGGDFEVFVKSGRRLLARTPLYAESGAGVGVVGPPFQAVFFAPFALVADLSMPLSRVTWYALGVAALLVGVALWSVALAERAPSGHRWSEVCSSAVLVPLFAVLLPVQTNFEHQNMNPLLLACLGVAAYCFRTERDAAAGAAIGTATALKAFPALLILYLAYWRAWRALTAAVVTAAALSAAPAFFYGSTGFVVQARQWVAFSTGGGWPTRGNNQSLIAMIQRLFGDAEPTLSSAVYVVAVVALLVVFLATAPTNRGADRRIAVVEMALVTLVAVIVSPIAWDHYWVLLFPAFFAVHDSRLYRNEWRAFALFWVALVLTSGFSRITVGRAGFDYARGASASTLAALLLFGMLLAVRRDMAPRTPP